jgi:hypothetical protein
MRKDEAFISLNASRIDALQSYVPWSNVEPERGKWDFSLYESLVENIIRHGLKWTPFLILGPRYSIPQWFQDSDESVPATCLEHGAQVGIQSIWNPHLGAHVDDFLGAVRKKFGGKGAIGSILLGISGNWGESIFPVQGGFKKDAHMHMGWWCGDEYALADFRAQMQMKYHVVSRLNRAWGTAYRRFDEVELPEPNAKFTFRQLVHSVGYRLFGWLPKELKALMKAAASKPKCDVQITGDLQRWVDFVKWYKGAMTRWSEFWMKTARKYFTDERIYIVTGGDSHPMMGADFFAQVKAAKAHGAGLRATSLNESYADSSFLSRLVSSPSRFYGTYFETEEAGVQESDGIAMRIYEGVTSGAAGMYFKSLFGYGYDFCEKAYHAPGKRTKGGEVLESYRGFLLYRRESHTEIAVLYPNIAIAIDPHVLALLKDFSVFLRRHVEFDLLDEGMVSDGALEGYKALIKFADHYVAPETGEMISKWVQNRGIYVSPAAGGRLELTLHGRGYFLNLPARGGYADQAASALCNTGGEYPWQGIVPYVCAPKGVYAAFDGDTSLILNSTGAEHAVRIWGSEYTLAPRSIVVVPRERNREAG